MPYKNIRFIKLMLELADDDRFTIDCNDNDKLIYFLLLLLAGLTINKIPNRPEYILKRFNLNLKTDEISTSIQRLIQFFPKLYQQNFKGKTLLKFRKFKKYHNLIGNSQGTPEELLGSAQNRIDKIRIDKNRIDNTTREDLKIIYLFAFKKSIKEFTKLQEQSFIKRNLRASGLLKGYPLERITEVMDWLIKNAEFKWTLESVGKFIDEDLSKLNITKELKL